MERLKVLETIKTKRVHQTSFTRNVKGTSLSKKEKATTRNMKRKKFIGKGKYTVKVVNQPCTKLVGRLKTKVVKSISAISS